MRALWTGTLLIGLVATALACTSDPDEVDPICEAGEERDCSCPDGGEGRAHCELGAWSACACEPGTGGTGGSGGVGGVGGVGGSGASGGSGGGTGGSGGTGGMGGSGGTLPEPVCTQVPDCVARVDEEVEAICTLDGCVPVGTEQGTIKVYGTFDPVMMPINSIRSFELRVFHGTNHIEQPLGCAELMATPGRSDPAWNGLYRTTGRVEGPGGIIPAMARNLPAPSTPAVIWLAFYGGQLDIDREPTGSIVGEGCLQGITIPAGPYTEDHEHVFSKEMLPPR